MTPFAPHRRRRAVAENVLATIVEWQAEYLAEQERQEGLAPRTLGQLGVAEVRQAAYMKSNELALNPGVVVWVAGASNHTSDPDDTKVIADVEIGVRIALAAAEDEASQLLHHTMAAFSQMLMDFPTCGGLSTDLVPVDEDYSPFEVADETWRCGVDLVFLAIGVEVGTRGSGPPPGSTPRDDPYEGPWPDALDVESTHLQVDPLDIVDPED